MDAEADHAKGGAVDAAGMALMLREFTVWLLHADDRLLKLWEKLLAGLFTEHIGGGREVVHRIPVIAAATGIVVAQKFGRFFQLSLIPIFVVGAERKERDATTSPHRGRGVSVLLVSEAMALLVGAPNIFDGVINRLLRNLELAVLRRPQTKDLPYGHGQIGVAGMRFVAPAAEVGVLATGLRVEDDFESAVEGLLHRLVVFLALHHAIGLTEREGADAVAVHPGLPLLAEVALGLRARPNEIEDAPLQIVPVLGLAGKLTGGHERHAGERGVGVGHVALKAPVRFLFGDEVVEALGDRFVNFVFGLELLEVGGVGFDGSLAQAFLGERGANEHQEGNSNAGCGLKVRATKHGPELRATLGEALHRFPRFLASASR